MNNEAVSGLKLFDVFDRGVPNKERLVLRAITPIDGSRFGIMVGLLLGSGNAIPLFDNLFWLGNGTVNTDEWILIFTSAGTATTYIDEPSNSRVHQLYWGRKKVIFHNPDLVPMLFHVPRVVIGSAPTGLQKTIN
jgi:hypothetical protein